jgi:transposase
VGIDLGDRYSRYCVVDGAGKVAEEERLFTCQVAFEAEFGKRPAMRVAMEAGTHSPWASRVLEASGHEVLVANPRKLRAIYTSRNKHDKLDARTLARLARVDPELLSPIRHRGEQAQVDLAHLRARRGLVEARTKLINSVRGMVKSFGGRLPRCSASSFPTKAAPHVPKPLWSAVAPVVDMIAQLTRHIRRIDSELDKVAATTYPETDRLRQVTGVGALTSLGYVLTIDDPSRFRRSRDVGPYFGLTPRHDESGDTKLQLGITKAGDKMIRSLLVGSAQYILGPFGPDCDLRRRGLELAKRGGKNAKKRAVVAVARRLAVLLHRLWVSGSTYEPLRHASTRRARRGQVAA